MEAGGSSFLQGLRDAEQLRQAPTRPLFEAEVADLLRWGNAAPNGFEQVTPPPSYVL